MQNSRSTRARNVIIAGLVIALAGRLLGWSLTSIFLALAALIVASWLVAYWQTWHSLGWHRTYHAFMTRIGSGDADAVIDELTQRRAQGDTSPLTTITLAAAYTHLGRGIEADPFALEAFNAITAHACAATGFSSRGRCDLAYLTYCDALLAQGRFIAAASTMRTHMRDALQPQFQTALTAWAYFLGDDHDTAREVLSEIPASWPRRDDTRRLSSRFLLLLAYIRHKLHVFEDSDTIADLDTHAAALDDWDAYATRNAANPYGARLTAIAADIRALLNLPTTTHEV